MRYDSYWDKVVLLMHFDAPDASFTFTDETGRHTFTRYGSYGRPIISNWHSKFGGSSLLMQDTYPGYLKTEDTDDFDFGSGPFTIEFWIYPFTRTSGCRVLMFGANGSNAGLQFWIDQNNFFWCGEPTSNNPIAGITSPAGCIPDNAWSHIALVWTSPSDYSFYANGVKTNSVVGGKAWPTGARCMSIGQDWSSGTGTFGGQIDEIRITKGVARYTSNFLPPTRAFGSVYGAGSIKGVTMEEGVPVPRKVRVYDRTTLELLNEFTSNNDGTFNVDMGDSGPFLLVALDDLGGLKYDAVTLDYVLSTGQP